MTRLAGRAARIALLFGVAAAAAGCSTDLEKAGGVLGLIQNRPDPFNVYPREPLRLPEDMSALPAPRPGAPSPLEPKPREEAQAALRGAGAPVAEAAPSAGEEALLARAGAGTADPAIRTQLEADYEGREREYGFDTFFGFKVPDGTEEELLEGREERKRLLEQGVATPNPPPEDVQPSNEWTFYY